MRKIPHYTAVILVLLMSTLHLVAHAQIIQGMSFSHKNWILACDNTGTCRAAGYAEEGNEGDFNLSILLTRPAGQNQPVQAVMSLGDWNDTDVSSRNLQLVIGDQPYCCSQVSDHSPLNPQQTQAILAAAKTDKTIAFIDTDTGEKGFLSGEGMAAILLKMDDFQGRINTPGALIRKGNKNEKNVLQPRSIRTLTVPNVLTDKDPAYKTLKEKYLSQTQKILDLTQTTYEDECAASEEKQQQIDIYPLNDKSLLISRPCWMGAYNIGEAYWVSDHHLKNVEFITSSGSYYDKGEIWSRQKGRGLGDCIWGEDYAWNGITFIKTTDFQTGFCRMQPGGFWTLTTTTYKLINPNNP